MKAEKATLRRKGIDNVLRRRIATTRGSGRVLRDSRTFHRKDAKSAKKGNELAHNRLNIRLMPSLDQSIRAGPAPMHGVA
jgi:hypothetical protein